MNRRCLWLILLLILVTVPVSAQEADGSGVFTDVDARATITISGTIVAEDGVTPLENIPVRVRYQTYIGGYSHHACTDANGNYDLSGIISGTGVNILAGGNSVTCTNTSYYSEYYFPLGFWKFYYGNVSGIDFSLTRENLLTNGEFEGEKVAGVPVGWTSSNTTLVAKDKQKCDKPDVEKYFSKYGDCAFMFKGNPTGELSKIKQVVSDTSGFTNGSTVEFSAYVDNRSATPGHTIGKVIIKYSNDTKDKLILKAPAESDYQLVADSVAIDLTNRTITKVKADLRYRLTSGKFFVDEANLAVAQPDALIPLPEAND